MRISDWSSDVCSSDLSCLLIRTFSGAYHSRTAMRGRSYSENAFCSWRRSIAPGACRCQPVRRSFFELNQEAHAQREPRCRDVIRWSKCSVAVLVFRSEEHTSERQSLMRTSYAVFCLKKKN